MNQPIEDTVAGTVRFPKDWSWLVIHAWLASRGLALEWWEGCCGQVTAHVQPGLPARKPGVTVIST